MLTTLKMFIWKRVCSFTIKFKNLVVEERSPKKLAASVSVGLFIAFSPFIFAHTIMVFIFAWIFSLNIPAVFIGACVNNPWTLIPCHLAGYCVGDFFLRTICRLDPFSIDPSWMAFINEPICKFTGLKGISFWSFFLGGNFLAVFVGIILYPILNLFFSRFSENR